MASRRRSLNGSRPGALARAAGRPEEFRVETLEPRVLLSDAPLEPVTVPWEDGHVVAIPDSWVVMFEEELGDQGAVDRVNDLMSAIGTVAYEISPIARGKYAEFMTKAPVNELSFGYGLSQVPGISSIDPNGLHAPQAIPNDPLFSEQWQHDNTGQFIQGQFGTPDADSDTTDAWDITFGSSDVIVGVIDTGIDFNHPDLQANIFVNPGEIPDNNVDDDGNGFVDDVSGWDFGDNDNDPQDVEGHGTAVAGTIGAVGNNDIGVAGVAWNVSIIPLRVSSPFFPGLLSSSAIIGANNYLTMMINQGFNIVASNNSYGSIQNQDLAEEFEPSDAEQASIQAFIDAGGTFVASAGNSSNDNDAATNPEDEEFDLSAFPASFPIPGIISVAATDNNDGLAGFSNFGNETVDFGAPGVNVFTTQLGGGYTFISGTSFSAPMTTGAVALLKTLKPNASPVEVREALINSVDPLPSLQGRTQAGGRLNIGRALEIIGLDGPVVTQVSPGPVTTDPVPEISVTFSEPIDPDVFASGGTGIAQIQRSGQKDGTFGDGNESNIGILDVELSEDLRTVTIEPASLLGAETYRLTLFAEFVQDDKGNFLNGSAVGGADEVYTFQAVSVSGKFEPNDTLANATPVPFTASGKATLTGATIGDGLFTNLDVDLYRIDIPSGGLITANILAKQLPSPSPLDSYLRLFDANGEELAFNDQFNGADSRIEFFVTTAGTYYVGVSGFSNSKYDPEEGGSGESQSLGGYTLELEVDLVEDDDLTVVDDLDGPIDIPDLDVITDTIFVADERQILDLDMTLDVSHDFVGDLEVSLIAPSGERILLSDNRGGPGEGYTGTIFDDEAGSPITAGVAPFTGPFRPEQSLGNFDGDSAAGFWTLEIVDNGPTGSGQLLDWSLDFILENNIFGPFELNDTLKTATDVGIDGNGSTTVEAVVGDGGFGDTDVDIFQFVANIGTTLSATATSDGAVNTALRLFDAQGNQLNLAAPPSGNDSSFGFVFSAGGTYYVAVSEDGNLEYDPTAAGSGAAATTTGGYSLSISVAPGVSDPDLRLVGNRIDATLSDDGTLGAPGEGLSFEGFDFLVSPTAQGEQFFGAIADDFGFKNSALEGSEVPFALTDESDAGNRRATTSGLFDDLFIERSLSFSEDGRIIAFDVHITNNSLETKTDVAWMEALNPNQGLSLNPASPNTFNDVADDAPFASARYTTNTFSDGLTVALAAPASDTRAQASFVQLLTEIRDPGQLLTLGVQDPNGAFDDQIMSLAFDMGDVLAGQTVSARYFLIFGTTPAQAESLYDSINDGSGTLHATEVGATPANDEAGLATLPFRLYYPEGFTNFRSSTFVPVLNPNNQESRVVIVARYETGERDQVLFDDTIAADSRGGITITTPALFAEDAQLTRKNTPYALEIRSELPVSATMSHFDFGGSTGESFTSETSEQWTFSRVTKGQGTSDFVVFFNPSDDIVKVTTTLLPAGGGEAIVLTQTLQPFRRGGWNLSAEPDVPEGTFGVVVETTQPIVAALTSFDTTPNDGTAGAFAEIGVPGLGSLSGASAEGQFGLNAQIESIPILNASTTDTNVELTFVFENGSSIRETVTVVGRSVTEFDVSSINNFPQGLPYGVLFESSLAPVSLSLPANGFNEHQTSAFSGSAHTLWTFADGFRPAQNPDQVTEFLRVFNPQNVDTLIEVTLQFTDGSSETTRQTIVGRRVAEFDVHSFIPEQLLNSPQFYGIVVKAAQPVVTYIGRNDAFFSGSFGTLLTPMGSTQPVV